MMEEQDKINYTTSVVIEGKTYFQSLAHQLAAFVCKKEYDNFRLSYKTGFMNAEIFMEEILVKGGYFFSEKLGKKCKIADLTYNAEVDKITFIITEPGKSGDYLAIQYEIFRYLRAFDIIRIKTIERKVRHKTTYVYTISKQNAQQWGHIVDTEKHGKKFVIHKSKFNCSVKEITKKKSKRR